MLRQRCAEGGARPPTASGAVSSATLQGATGSPRRGRSPDLRRSWMGCLLDRHGVHARGTVRESRTWRRSGLRPDGSWFRSEEHTSELQSLMRNSYAVFGLKKKKTANDNNTYNNDYKCTSIQ